MVERSYSKQRVARKNTEDSEKFKLELKDFVPFVGGERYLTRNEDSYFEYPRPSIEETARDVFNCLVLLSWNIGSVYTIGKTLESIFR